MLTAVLLFSFAPLLVKLLHNKVPVFQIVVARSFLSAIGTYTVARSLGLQTMFGQKQNIPWLFMRGIFGGICMTLYYFQIDFLPMADAVTIFFSNGVVTTLFAVVLLGERLALIGILGVFISLQGVVLVVRPGFLFGSAYVWTHAREFGVLVDLVAVVSYAIGTMAIRVIGHTESSVTLTLWYHLCATVTALPFLVVGYPAPAVLPTALEMVYMFGVAFTSFLGQLVLNRGFQLLPAQESSTLNTLQVVFSHLLGSIFLHEETTVVGFVGQLLVVFGVMAVNMGKIKKQELVLVPEYDEEEVEDIYINDGAEPDIVRISTVPMIDEARSFDAEGWDEPLLARAQNSVGMTIQGQRLPMYEDFLLGESLGTSGEVEARFLGSMHSRLDRLSSTRFHDKEDRSYRGYYRESSGIGDNEDRSNRGYYRETSRTGDNEDRSYRGYYREASRGGNKNAGNSTEHDKENKQEASRVFDREESGVFDRDF